MPPYFKRKKPILIGFKFNNTGGGGYIVDVISLYILQ